MNKAPFHIESASAGWEEMHGMPVEALLGRSLRVLEGPGTDLRAVNRLMDAAGRGVESQSSYLTYRADGKRMWTHFAVEPLLSEAGTIDSFVAETFSYQVLGHAEAVSQVQGFQLLVDLQDPNRCIAHISQPLCQLLNMAQTQLVGQPLDAVLASSASSQLVAKVVAEAVHGVALQQVGTNFVALRAGAQALATVTARVAAVPVVGVDGQVTHVLLALEPGCSCDAQEEEMGRLRERLEQVQGQLSAANDAADTWRGRALAAEQAAEMLRLEMQALLLPPGSASHAHILLGGADRQGCHEPVCHLSSLCSSAERVHQEVLPVPLIQRIVAKLAAEPIFTSLAICDGQGCILWANELFLRTVGYPSHELVGCQWNMVLCSPETDVAEMTRTQAIMEMQLPLLSCVRILRANGQTCQMQVRLEPARVAHRDGILSLQLLSLEDVSHLTRGASDSMPSASSASTTASCSAHAPSGPGGKMVSLLHPSMPSSWYLSPLYQGVNTKRYTIILHPKC